MNSIVANRFWAAFHNTQAGVQRICSELALLALDMELCVLQVEEMWVFPKVSGKKETDFTSFFTYTVMVS